ncbi:monocarboxylate transporter 12-like [Patiria miniata]|uniref:Major facilitator superfamily (MFS) profile domain-containing protein n=1 Tax=Patiria miniata TaxID=46514 RepID=A0A914B0B1_PATMI|nr:monocarboxylate transporter 12-like [Patiria miniata]
MGSAGGVTEGGRAGWLVVLALWTRLFLMVGVLKSIGMMIPLLQDQFNTSTWIMGWISSIIGTSTGISGIFAKLIGRRFGPGYAIMTCGVMISASVIIASFATSPGHLACVFVVLLGTGFGISGVLMKEVIGRCFTTNYATATGIARTGDSAGLIVCAPLFQLFLDTYGWRGAMLLMGAISMHLVVCGALMVRAGASPTSTYQELSGDDVISEPSQLPACCDALSRNLSRNFEIQLLSDYRYWAAASVAFCTKYAFNMWIIYFVSQAQSNGFSLEDAATFVTVAGVGGLLGRLAQGILMDRKIIPLFPLTAITITVCSASFCATPFLTSYWLMMTSSLTIATFSGALYCLQDVICKQVLGVNLLAGAFGWTGITSATMDFALGFIPGWIYDTTGSYTTAFIFLGSVQFIPMFPLLILRYKGWVE